MPNGAHALAVLAIDRPAKATTIKPDASPAPAEIEQRIGEAAADAASAISIGIADFVETGSFAPNTKALGGRTLADVVMLALEHFGEFDFDLVARRAGRRVLEERHGAILRTQLGARKTDAAFDDLLGHVLLIANQVVSDERARAN